LAFLEARQGGEELDFADAEQLVPREVIEKARDLNEAYEAVEEKREVLIQRFRRAIGADIVTYDAPESASL